MTKKEQSITAPDVLHRIEQNQIDPLYLLHGEEIFLIDDVVQHLLAKTVDPAIAAFNLDIFNGKEADIRQIVSTIPAWPMMGERRVVVVRNVDKMMKSDRDALIPFIASPPSSTCQVYTAEKTNAREKFFSTALATATCVSCDSFYENMIPQWLQTRFRKINKQIEPKALARLQQSVGTSLYDLANEVEKLDVYTMKRTQITESDVEFVVGSWRVNTVYELHKKIGHRKTGEALILMRKIMTSGEPAIKIVISLMYFFQNLLKIHVLLDRKVPPKSMAGQVGMNPFFIDEAITQAKKFNISELERNFSLLYDADVQLKTSAGVPDALMERLAYQLCAKS